MKLLIGYCNLLFLSTDLNSGDASIFGTLHFIFVNSSCIILSLTLAITLSFLIALAIYSSVRSSNPFPSNFVHFTKASWRYLLANFLVNFLIDLKGAFLSTPCHLTLSIIISDILPKKCKISLKRWFSDTVNQLESALNFCQQYVLVDLMI